MKRVQIRFCRLCIALLLFLVSINFTLIHASQLLPGFDLEALDKRLIDRVKEREMVGLSIAIMIDGKLEFARSYGSQSLKEGRSMETNTMLAVGSVTKQFTCAAVL